MHRKFPAPESLEARTLLSAAYVSGHTLMVVGDTNTPNAISVDYNASGSAIVVSVNPKSPTGLTQSFPKTPAIKAVVVHGGAQNDTITVGQTGKAFNINTTVFGLAGADNIKTGPENDSIQAGAGNDTVFSGNGNDTVHGGTGNDSITAGNGNDVLYGDDGADVIKAGNGNDLIRGNTGNDTITAGNGNDSLWGGYGDDVITAGNGRDTLGGILGRNTLLGGTGHDTYYVSVLKNNVTNYNSKKDTLVITKRNDDSL